LFNHDTDAEIIALALVVTIVFACVVVIMAAKGMFSDPNYQPRDEDEDGGEY
jgi:hypothetical protein